MKLLMVGPTPKPYTGQSVSFKKLKDSFELDKDVCVYHVQTSPSNKSTHITGKLGLTRILDTFHMFLAFIYYLIIKRPEVIYLTKGSTKFGFLRDYFLISFKRLFSPKARFIVHLKGGNYDDFYESCSPLFRKLVRSFLEQADSIIVLGNSLVKMYDFMPRLISKIIVIKNALTFDVNSREDDFTSEKVTFLFLSNLIYTKGYTHICKAAEQLNRSGNYNFEVIFAGQFMESPDDPEDLEKNRENFLSISNNPENEYIKYIGTVSGQKKIDILNKADVLLLPTNYHVEGQPVCIIEAMAYSCAILATKYRSIPDLIDSTNSRFVKYADVDGLASEMAFLINNKSQLESMGKMSKFKFSNEFTWARHYSKIKRVILGLK